MSLSPYPIAPELVNLEDLAQDITPIELSEESKNAVNGVVEKLETSIKEIQGIRLFTHTYYPQAYEDKQGRTLFNTIYCNENFYVEIRRILNEHGIQEPNINSDKEAEENWNLLWEAIFEDLQTSIFADTFDGTNSSPVIFANTAKVLKIDNIELNVDFSQPTSSQIEIANIPEGIRRASNKWSASICREMFIHGFIENKGDVTKIENPKVVETLINVADFILKIRGYRKLKTLLKASRADLHQRSLDISELLAYDPKIGNDFNEELNRNSYLERLYSLYQEYINYKIAEMYKYAVVVAKKPIEKRSQEETDLLEEFKLQSDSSKSLKHVDMFLNGSPQISSILEDYGNIRKSQTDSRDESLSEEYIKYNAVKLNQQQQIELANLYFDLIRTQIPDFPKVKVEAAVGKQKTYSVVGTSKLKIPNTELGMVDFLSKLSAEVEGHIYRKYLTKQMGIAYKYISPRDSVLSEGHSNYVSGTTKETIVGIKRTSQPYYLAAIQTKNASGGFKECYKSVIDLLATRRFKKSNINELTGEELKTATSYAYTTTERIFKRSTPYDDTSGRITASDDLDYLRGEMVYSNLQKLGIENIASVDGTDLYSLQRLKEMGLLNLSDQTEPLVIVASVFWPEIKKLLDQKINPEELINELRKGLKI